MHKLVVLIAISLLIVLPIKSEAQQISKIDMQNNRIYFLLDIRPNCYQWEYSKELYSATWGSKVNDIEKVKSNIDFSLLPQIAIFYDPIFIRGFYGQSSCNFQSYGKGSLDNFGIDIGVGTPILGLALFFGWRQMNSKFENWATNNAKDFSVSDFGMGISVGYPVQIINYQGLVINGQGFLGFNTPILGRESNQPTTIEAEVNVGYKFRKPNLVLNIGYGYKEYGKTGQVFRLNYKDYMYQSSNRIKSISITAIYAL